ncbi:MAG: glycoside hydrolase family 172 protein [Anaerolineae bacterium]
MSLGMASLQDLARLGAGIRSRRWSSFDKTGGNADWWPIAAGQTVLLGETDQPGCVKHIWMTTREDGNNLRRLVVRMYWDGEDTPSVVSPIGDFFGLGHAKGNYFESLPLQASYLALNCWFPMPYGKGARITVTNDSDADSFLYFYVDRQEWDEAPDDLGRFHAHWRRQLVVAKDEQRGANARGTDDRLNTTGRDNYLVMDAKGKGHYVGCCLHVDTNETGWWGEGDDMMFIDGEGWPPSLHGTGTEDYFCGAWNYNGLSKPYSTPYYGYSFRGNADYTGKHSQYRFHIEDPVYFEKSLRVSIEHGHSNDRQGDWTSTAYWYQVGRTEPLPEIGGWEDRIPYAFGGLERWPGKDRKALPY